MGKELSAFYFSTSQQSQGQLRNDAEGQQEYEDVPCRKLTLLLISRGFPLKLAIYKSRFGF